MQHDEENKAVRFEVGDFVGDVTTGVERFGTVVKVHHEADGDVLVVESAETKGATWEVAEKDVYPG